MSRQMLLDAKMKQYRALLERSFATVDLTLAQLINQSSKDQPTQTTRLDLSTYASDERLMILSIFEDFGLEVKTHANFHYTIILNV